MKTIFAVAALAAATLATAVLAQEASSGHYEWQTRQVPGPNKPNTTSRVRVWVKDKPAQMANCDCDLMKSSPDDCMKPASRSEEHTSELQSLMRISYAVFCLKKKNKNQSTKTKKTPYNK